MISSQFPQNKVVVYDLNPLFVRYVPVLICFLLLRIISNNSISFTIVVHAIFFFISVNNNLKSVCFMRDKNKFSENMQRCDLWASLKRSWFICVGICVCLWSVLLSFQLHGELNKNAVETKVIYYLNKNVNTDWTLNQYLFFLCFTVLYISCEANVF